MYLGLCTDVSKYFAVKKKIFTFNYYEMNIFGGKTFYAYLTNQNRILQLIMFIKIVKNKNCN